MPRSKRCMAKLWRKVWELTRCLIEQARRLRFLGGRVLREFHLRQRHHPPNVLTVQKAQGLPRLASGGWHALKVLLKYS